MRPEILEAIFKHLCDNQLPHLKRIDLHNGGETLLHSDLPSMLSIIRRAKERIEAKPIIGMLTNAMLLTEKKSLQILRSRAVDQMRFSLDGGSPEEYERIRVGAKWDVVKNNIMRFLILNRQSDRPTSTEAICIVEDRGRDTIPFSIDFKNLLALFDKVSLRHPHNWDGSTDLGIDDASYREIARQRIGEPCFLLLKNMVVLPDGSITVCCNDLNARGVMGSVQNLPLREFANHPKRLCMIEMFRRGEKNRLELCKNCTGFYSEPRT